MNLQDNDLVALDFAQHGRGYPRPRNGRGAHLGVVVAAQQEDALESERVLVGSILEVEIQHIALGDGVLATVVFDNRVHGRSPTRYVGLPKGQILRRSARPAGPLPGQQENAELLEPRSTDVDSIPA